MNTLMTDPVTMGLAALATSVALVNLLLSMPRPPDLDAERWFKVILVNLLVGEFDDSQADKASFDAWVNAVKQRVPFHPDARHPERVIVPAHDLTPEEKGVVERLEAYTERSDRWRDLFEVDERGLGARLDDPAVQLGATYDPQHWTRVTTWRDVQATGAGDTKLLDTLAQQNDCIWVLVDAPSEGPDVIGALADVVSDPIRVPADREGLLAELFAHDLHRRVDYSVVFVAAGEGIQAVLEALHTQRGLRDTTAMVLALDPEFDDAWMVEHFTHHEMDAERDHLAPYVALQWLDRNQGTPVGAFGRGLASARFPEVPTETMTREVVQPLELGVMPHDSDPLFVARGLAVFVGLWVLATAA